jgi:hypothetical protein
MKLPRFHRTPCFPSEFSGTLGGSLHVDRDLLSEKKCRKSSRLVNSGISMNNQD